MSQFDFIVIVYFLKKKENKYLGFNLPDFF